MNLDLGIKRFYTIRNLGIRISVYSGNFVGCNCEGEEDTRFDIQETHACIVFLEGVISKRSLHQFIWDIDVLEHTVDEIGLYREHVDPWSLFNPHHVLKHRILDKCFQAEFCQDASFLIRNNMPNIRIRNSCHI
jgi:hypothetical protein